MHEASEPLSRCFALRHHAWMQMLCHRRAALVQRPLNTAWGMLYRRMLRPEMVAHLFRGQIGRMKLRRHSAAALHFGIML